MKLKRVIRKYLSLLRHSFRSLYNYALGKDIDIHNSCIVSRKSVIRANGTGAIKIGRNCEIHDYAMIIAHENGGNITIGDDCSVNPFTILYGGGGTLYW